MKKATMTFKFYAFSQLNKICVC